jgi:hypothetical protein
MTTLKLQLNLALEHLQEAQRLADQPPVRRVPGPFHLGQRVRNVDTGFPAVVVGFAGYGRVVLKSTVSSQKYTKNYRYLEAL